MEIANNKDEIKNYIENEELEKNKNVKIENERLESKKNEDNKKIILNNSMKIKVGKIYKGENNKINTIKDTNPEDKINNINRNPEKKEESSTKQDTLLNSNEKIEEEKDDFPKDSVSKSPLKPEIKLSNSEIPRDRDELPLNNTNSENNEVNAISKFNNSLNKNEQENPPSNNSSQDKIPDLNNEDDNQEKIQEIKPVIQHNIERKRPVFTLPPDKNSSISQEKPFHLVQKYYDENFILEDDEEEGFKQYIFNNENSRDESINNSKNDININNNNIKINNEEENEKEGNLNDNINNKDLENVYKKMIDNDIDKEQGNK